MVKVIRGLNQIMLAKKPQTISDIAASRLITIAKGQSCFPRNLNNNSFEALARASDWPCQVCSSHGHRTRVPLCPFIRACVIHFGLPGYPQVLSMKPHQIQQQVAFLAESFQLTVWYQVCSEKCVISVLCFGILVCEIILWNCYLILWYYLKSFCSNFSPYEMSWIPRGQLHFRTISSFSLSLIFFSELICFPRFFSLFLYNFFRLTLLLIICVCVMMCIWVTMNA